jgi:lipopolysaccharide biosynthesis glycosyltransferase
VPSFRRLVNGERLLQSIAMTAAGMLRKSDCAIVLCADHKYFPPAYIVCLALARTWPSRADIHLLTEPGPHLDRVPTDTPFKIGTPDFVGQFPDAPDAMRTLGPFACLRLLLPELLEGYRRVLYLDSDIRIAGSLDPLFDLDMKGAPFAAVDDLMKFYPPSIISGTPHRLKIGMKEEDSYFNSGVMLIDCAQWRRKRMTTAAIDCMRRLAPVARFHDQDALNVAFCNEWLPLSPRWNWPPTAFESDVEAVMQPVVFHHIFQKAWNSDDPKWRERKLFESALRDTPYHDFMAGRAYPDFKRAVEWHLKRAFQNATFFLPSSRKRIRARKRVGSTGFAAYILKNIESRRFADFDQEISNIDLSALSGVARKDDSGY